MPRESGRPLTPPFDDKRSLSRAIWLPCQMPTRVPTPVRNVSMTPVPPDNLPDGIRAVAIPKRKPASERHRLQNRKDNPMPFFGLEPFDTAEATYVWTGLGQPGFFHVTVKGNARKFSFGFQLKRDPEFVGGLAIEVMGWTGPLALEGTVPYTVSATFNGTFLPEIVIIGANKTEVIKVKEVPFKSEEDVAKAFAAA